MNLNRYPEQTKKNAKKFVIKRSKDSWTKERDLRHTLSQYLLQQNRFETGEGKPIEKEEDTRRQATLSLAMRTEP